MHEVLAASLSFPSVLFTVVLGIAVVYWLFVIVGAIDLDGSDAAGLDLDVGHVEIDGVAKGVLEGAAKGMAEAGADAAVDGHDGLASLFASLELNRAPATVVLSFLAAFGWLLSVVATIVAEPAWSVWGLPRWALGVLVLLLSIAGSLPLTSLAVRPLGPLFATRAAKSKRDFIGQVCVISTGRVDDRFGQATLEDGGAGLILDVRCDAPGALRQGDRALLVSWDAERELFCVEPLDDLLGGPSPKGQRAGAGSPRGAAPGSAAPGTAAPGGAPVAAEVDADDALSVSSPARGSARES